MAIQAEVMKKLKSLQLRLRRLQSGAHLQHPNPPNTPAASASAAGASFGGDQVKEFWKSKVFWTAIGVIISNALALVGALGTFNLSAEVTTAILAVWNSILGVLAIVFRWGATEQLTMQSQQPRVRR